MSRVVLFGGSGFIGSAIRGGIRDVVAPPRSEVDLADPASVRTFLRAGDVIVNAAGYARASDRSAAGDERFRRENVRAVEILADAAAEARAGRIVHLSSVAAMGQREGAGLTEGAMAEPASPYGRSKRDAERALEARRDLVPITILRPTSVFGEGRPMAEVLCRVASLPLVPLPRGGSALVPFTHVDNVVEAVRVAIGCEACAGGTFIVGDERSYPLRDIVAGLARGMGRTRLPAIPVPTVAVQLAGAIERALRRGRRPPLLDTVRIDTLTRSISFSIDAFQAATGFRPPVGLDEATHRIGAWHVGRSDG